MAFELDHVFIWAPQKSDAAAKLTGCGLTEGAPNTHPGQGTACRRFFFHNGYIELLWVTEPSEAQSTITSACHLWERWSGLDRGACPFGVGLRPHSTSGLDKELPFPAFEYQPVYLPSSWRIHVATNADALSEPFLFFLPFCRRPDSTPPESRQPIEHPSGVREITRVEFISPEAELRSRAYQAVISAKLIGLRSGPAHSLELGFDEESRGERYDLRPELPIVLSW